MTRWSTRAGEEALGPNWREWLFLWPWKLGLHLGLALALGVGAELTSPRPLRQPFQFGPGLQSTIQSSGREAVLRATRERAWHLVSSGCVLGSYVVSPLELTSLCGPVAVFAYQPGCCPREVGVDPWPQWRLDGTQAHLSPRPASSLAVRAWLPGPLRVLWTGLLSLWASVFHLENEVLD